MLEEIRCNCEENFSYIFDKDYEKASLIIERDGAYYEWRCPKCGQRHRRKTKEPITIK